MINLSDIHPLTGFLRDHKVHMERLEATGRPEVLTVNGRAKLVIQDATAYQKMIEAMDELDAIRVLRTRIQGIPKDNAGIPAATVLDELKLQLGLDQ